MNTHPDTRNGTRWRRLLVIGNRLGLTCLILVAAGYRGIPRADEKQARHDLQTVGQVYRPQGQRPTLPTLSTNSGLSNFLAHALLNQPRVEAAYFDWAASVERITVARSRPDPRLMFSTDIRAMVMSIMGGLAQDFPGPGKLGARAAVTSAESTASYFVFESAVVVGMSKEGRHEPLVGVFEWAHKHFPNFVDCPPSMCARPWSKPASPSERR